jgi:hypothetical protein
MNAENKKLREEIVALRADIEILRAHKAAKPPDVFFLEGNVVTSIGRGRNVA